MLTHKNLLDLHQKYLDLQRDLHKDLTKNQGRREKNILSKIESTKDSMDYGIYMAALVFGDNDFSDCSLTWANTLVEGRNFEPHMLLDTEKINRLYHCTIGAFHAMRAFHQGFDVSLEGVAHVTEYFNGGFCGIHLNDEAMDYEQSGCADHSCIILIFDRGLISEVRII